MPAICIGLLVAGQSVLGGETDPERLKKFLLKNYDKHVQPVTLHTNKTIHFGVALIHLDVSESESVLVTDTWLRFIWNEPKFKWNPEDYGNISVLRMANDQIWKPDIMLYNK